MSLKKTKTMLFNLQLYMKYHDSDFVIVSQTGKEIPCHKFVLAMTSPVFEAMLEMKESKEVSNGRVEIIDVSDQALEAMVNFIYTNDIQENEDVYEDLLILANKYDLKKLAEKIIPKFVAKLDVDNCIEGYVFGFLHHYEKIKEAARMIIVSEWDWLQKEKKEELKKFSGMYPKEFEDLMEKISRIQEQTLTALTLAAIMNETIFTFRNYPLPPCRKT